MRREIKIRWSFNMKKDYKDMDYWELKVEAQKAYNEWKLLSVLAEKKQHEER